MADVFEIDWLTRMKTDPKANSILNNKTMFEQFDTFDVYFNVPRNMIRRRDRQIFTRRKNQLYSDRYTRPWIQFSNRPLGRYRHDEAPARHIVEMRDNPNKYWENTLAGSIYNKPSIDKSPNPHIEKLAYKE